MTELEKKRTLLIQRQNDQFRKAMIQYTWETPDKKVEGQYVVAQCLNELDHGSKMLIVLEVFHFDKFTEDNDPHGEHDFGAFTYEGHKIFWKIDYYDTNYEMGSKDPSDLTITRRILTMMLASE